MAFNWSAKNLPKQIFINNEYVSAKSTKTLTLNNPKDGSLIADDVALAGEQDVDAAVAAAEKAFPAWKKLSAAERRNIMLKFAGLIEKYTQEIAELTRISLGAPFKAFGAFEIGLCAEVYPPLRFLTLSFLGQMLTCSCRHSNTTPDT
jgi:aldehyde dehydrogenase (NAD+)